MKQQIQTKMTRLKQNKIYDFLFSEDTLNKQSVIFNIIILVIGLIYTTILITNHEAFRDEAQAWFIAKDTPISELGKEIKLEGHPFLWFAVLMPFAKLGFSYIWMYVLSALFTYAGVALILFKTNLNRFLKFFIVINPLILFWYPVEARNYCLSLFFICALLVLYKDRDKKPVLYGICLFLLANTHVIMFGFVLALIILQIIDEINCIVKKIKVPIKNHIGVLISIFGLVTLYLQLSGANDSNADVVIDLPDDIIYTFFGKIYKMGRAYFGIETIQLNIQMLMMSLFLIIMLVTLICLFKFPRSLTVFILGVGCIVGVQGTFYFVSVHRTGLIVYILLFIAYNISLEKQILKRKISEEQPLLKKEIEIKPNIILRGLVTFTMFISLVLCPFTISFQDIFQDFSGSKATAKYIEENIKPGATIICYDDNYVTPIIMYLSNDYFFYSSYLKNEFSYIPWTKPRQIEKIKYYKYIYESSFVKTARKNGFDYDSKIYFFDNINYDINSQLNSNKDVYILVAGCYKDVIKYDQSKKKPTLLYNSKIKNPSVYDESENYYIYKF